MRYTIVIDIKTNNDAFQYDKIAECKRILSGVFNSVMNDYTNGRCTDINGNCVGGYSVKITGVNK